MIEYSFTSTRSDRPRGLGTAVAASFFLFALASFGYLSSSRYADIDCPSVLEARPGATIAIPVRIHNKSHSRMASTEQFYLSGKLRGEGRAEEATLPRTEIDVPPGGTRDYSLNLSAPGEAGAYVLEVDIVKEGEYWLSDMGNDAAVAKLNVRDGQ